jgi:phosphohistidine swiveling domain-containing protein
MNKKASAANALYELHHALDSIVLPVSRRILKLNCFSRSRDNFDWDLLNDIGIINLLRKDYLRHGSIRRTFELYQSTRLDTRSHRYESLFALLIVTIVGTFTAGLALDLYNSNKDKLGGWLQRLRAEARLFGGESDSDADERFRELLEHRERLRLAHKFASATAKEVLDDFGIILQCFFEKSRSGDESLWRRYQEFSRDYTSSDRNIDKGKVLKAIEAYTKGTLAQKLDEVGVELEIPKNTDVAAIFHGIPVGAGGASGISHVLGCERVKTTHPIIVAADATWFGPQDMEWIASSAGVVTTNCGPTGHIPVICRGLGIPCAIIKNEEFARIVNGQRLGLSGTTGLVGVGVVVSL